ncbi:TRAP transporter substrate-binding protein [Oceaniglobus trochenteri]|uniref:TRAP transporter substrate-binding protein n=1 Tax=Oceaniglobus trochenteri TaxID=2763260 RepID=UPI001CFF8659|nr:TRAP transporter substrate-binding protein [Oceaniglobus trochenteri]
MKTYLAAVATTLALAAPAMADKVTLNMAGFYPRTLTQLGEAGARLESTVNAIGGDALGIKLFEPGALVPSLEIFDAVASGSIDMGSSVSGLWASKNSALNIFSSVPFGPEAGEYLAWMWHGGGQELLNEIYHPLGVHGMVCGMVAPEASGWFREEITSTADLAGLKMRFFGPGAQVMQKMGVDTQLLAGGDIYPALERGTIDATEFSMPAVDQGAGLYNIAKHYYFPGWHQQATVQEILVNKARWDGMTEEQQAILQTACEATTAWQFSEGEAIQFKALQEMQAEGVTLHRWSDEILDEYRTAWEEVAAEEAAANPDFDRVWNALQAFRKDYAVWKELGYLD